jgi:hypothetical protein
MLFSVTFYVGMRDVCYVAGTATLRRKRFQKEKEMIVWCLLLADQLLSFQYSDLQIRRE